MHERWRKGAWDNKEDKLLARAVEKHGYQWAIAGAVFCYFFLVTVVPAGETFPKPLELEVEIVNANPRASYRN